MQTSQGKVRVLVMSGTFFSRSLSDLLLPMKMSLGRQSPIPLDPAELMRWCWALDTKVNEWERWDAGVLREHFSADVLAGLGRYILETPGVVGTVGTPYQVPSALSLKVYSLPSNTKDVKRLKDTWELPDGQELEQATQVWQYERELASGFFYRWEPAPPRAWLDARRDKDAFVRNKLARSKKWDSPHHLELAVRQGKVQDPDGVFVKWRAIENTYQGKQVVVWRDDTVLRAAQQWAAENPEGIIFLEHRALGNELSKRLKCPYFADNPEQSIEEFGSGLCVASIPANKTGRNLQAWCRALVISPPSSGQSWEQLLGRLHRQGQTADNVTYDVLVTCPADKKALQQSLRDSAAQSRLYLSDQKLTTAKRTQEKWQSNHRK